MIRKSILIPLFILEAVLTFVIFYYLKGDTLLTASLITVVTSILFFVGNHYGMKKQQLKEDEEYA
ncbi:MAG: hypothetical protein ACE364_11950 [Chlorobiota bacterium]